MEISTGEGASPARLERSNSWTSHDVGMVHFLSCVEGARLCKDELGIELREPGPSCSNFCVSGCCNCVELEARFCPIGNSFGTASSTGFSLSGGGEVSTGGTASSSYDRSDRGFNRPPTGAFFLKKYLSFGGK